MPTYQCSCGARYRFADEYAGQRSRCKRCGQVFALEASDGGIADPSAVPIQGKAFGESGLDRPVEPLPVSPPGVEPSAVGTFTVPPVIIEPPEREKTYWMDLLDTFCFLSKLDNVLRFFVMWFWVCLYVGLTAILPFGAYGWYVFGVIGLVIVYGAYCAFRFGVIEEAASGSDELPEIVPSTDLWDSTAAPFFNWMGSWLVVLSPAIAYVIIRAVSGSPITFLGGVSGSEGLGVFLEAAMAAKEYVLLGLLVLGFLAWPMIVLCVALGGFSCLGRIDLAIETALKTLSMYLLTALIASAQLIIYWPEMSFGAGFIRLILFVGVGLWLEIIALRAVGLYYHHFKDKFAWSWE
jgi:hypothetical protein